jgi:two-component system invasion response regulator UvrY
MSLALWWCMYGSSIFGSSSATAVRAIRVLLCDDHLIVRQGLKQALAGVPDVSVVDETVTGAGVLHLTQSLMPDVLLLDLSMAGRDSWALLRALRTQCPRVPVLILSTFPERQYAVLCLRLGASGYLHKSADAPELLAAIRALATGHLHVTPGAAEALGAFLRHQLAPLALAAFSPREQQVLRELACGESLEQIAAQLALSLDTVSTCKARLLEKTGARNHVELALYAARQQPFDLLQPARAARNHHEPF